MHCRLLIAWLVVYSSRSPFLPRVSRQPPTRPVVAVLAGNVCLLLFLLWESFLRTDSRRFRTESDKRGDIEALVQPVHSMGVHSLAHQPISSSANQDRASNWPSDHLGNQCHLVLLPAYACSSLQTIDLMLLPIYVTVSFVFSFPLVHSLSCFPQAAVAISIRVQMMCHGNFSALPY